MKQHSSHHGVLAFLVTSALAALPAHGATVHVPADFPTIQQAVDAAVPGDRVLVAAGVYNEQVRIINKRITLVSELGPFFTVIDGTGLSDAIVRVQDQTPSDDVVIRGFTVTNADAGCTGIVTYGDEDAVVTIDNCWSHDNPGGGISVGGVSAVIKHSRVFDNQDTGATNPGGAGIWLSHSGEGATITITDCEIENNDADTDDGGGILVGAGTVTISDCTILGNSAARGAGIFTDSSAEDIEIVNCLIAGNSASLAGGGIFAENGGFNMTVINATLSRNSAPIGSGISGDGSMLVTVKNAIVYDNEDGPDFDDDFVSASMLRYSCVPAPWAEQGNDCVSQPPCFLDPGASDYRLRNSSSCVDAADNSAVPSWVTTDLDGGSRFRNDPFKQDTGNGTAPIVDMGCYERNASGINPRRYVNLLATGLDNGRTWANAYDDLQDALDEARTGDVSEIWVAAGTYKPDRGSGDRTASFELVNGVGVFGGFNGTETSRGQRDVDLNQTLLSGAIGGGSSSDNSYHVVAANTVFSGTELNGFLVQKGNANGAPIYWQRGAGIYVFNAKPTIKFCWIRQNESNEDGAGAYAEIGAPVLVDCRFHQNLSNGAGGGFADHGGAAMLYGCLFDGNVARSGGGLKGYQSIDLRVVNCTFSANYATVDFGGGMSLGGAGIASVSNCILWDNDAWAGSTRQRNLNAGPSSALTVAHSCVAGYDDAYGSEGNVTSNPRFIDSDGADGFPGNSDDNLRVVSGSACVDTGSSGAVPIELVLDLDHHARVLNQLVDMGAYEYLGGRSIGDLGAGNASDANR